MVITFKSIARSLKQFPTRTFSNSSCAGDEAQSGVCCLHCLPKLPLALAAQFCRTILLKGFSARLRMPGRKSKSCWWKGRCVWVKDQTDAICWFFFFLQALQRITVENLVFTVQFKRGTLTFHHGGNISFPQLSVRETALLVSFKFFLSL